MSDLQQQYERESIVLRFIWMLAFALAWQVAEVLLLVVVLVQLGWRLLNGRLNADLLELGDSLSQYLAQIGRFVTFNSAEKPWPVADWPMPQQNQQRTVEIKADQPAPRTRPTSEA